MPAGSDDRAVPPADHGHDHGHDHDFEVAPEVARLLWGAVLVILALTVVGAAVWWRGDGTELPEAFGDRGQRVDATVTDVVAGRCPGGDFLGENFFDGEAPTAPPALECDAVELEVTSGANAGATTSLETYPDGGSPTFEVGDRLVLTEFEVPGGATAYSFADFQRDRPLLLLGALFVIAVVALGRFQGVRAIGGLVVSALVLFLYVFSPPCSTPNRRSRSPWSPRRPSPSRPCNSLTGSRRPPPAISTAPAYASAAITSPRP